MFFPSQATPNTTKLDLVVSGIDKGIEAESRAVTAFLRGNPNIGLPPQNTHWLAFGTGGDVKVAAIGTDAKTVGQTLEVYSPVTAKTYSDAVRKAATKLSAGQAENLVYDLTQSGQQFSAISPSFADDINVFLSQIKPGATKVKDVFVLDGDTIVAIIKATK